MPDAPVIHSTVVHSRVVAMSVGRSKAFAMMSLKEEDAHADLTGVPDDHLKILDDWYNKLTQKYPTCGRVINESAAVQSADDSIPAPAEPLSSAPPVAGAG